MAGISLFRSSGEKKIDLSSANNLFDYIMSLMDDKNLVDVEKKNEYKIDTVNYRTCFGAITNNSNHNDVFFTNFYTDTGWGEVTYNYYIGRESITHINRNDWEYKLYNYAVGKSTSKSIRKYCFNGYTRTESTIKNTYINEQSSYITRGFDYYRTSEMLPPQGRINVLVYKNDLTKLHVITQYSQSTDCYEFYFIINAPKGYKFKLI